MSGNVISLKAVRELKSSKDEENAYHARILSMDKLELLEEMVQFQQARSRVGELTPKMILQGRILFKALEGSAETEELRLLTRSYRRHLELEWNDYLRKNSLPGR